MGPSGPVFLAAIAQIVVCTGPRRDKISFETFSTLLPRQGGLDGRRRDPESHHRGPSRHRGWKKGFRIRNLRDPHELARKIPRITPKGCKRL